MATIDRINRLQRQLTASTSRSTVDNINTDPDHVREVWRVLRDVGVADQFLPDGMTLDDLANYLTDDRRSGTDG